MCKNITESWRKKFEFHFSIRFTSRPNQISHVLFLANQIMDGEGDNDADLVAAAHPRFCDAVKTDSPEYAALFKRTFQNKTFHVYRVRKKAKKNS